MGDITSLESHAKPWTQAKQSLPLSGSSKGDNWTLSSCPHFSGWKHTDHITWGVLLFFWGVCGFSSAGSMVLSHRAMWCCQSRQLIPTLFPKFLFSHLYSIKNSCDCTQAPILRAALPEHSRWPCVCRAALTHTFEWNGNWQCQGIVSARLQRIHAIIFCRNSSCQPCTVLMSLEILKMKNWEKKNAGNSSLWSQQHFWDRKDDSQGKRWS